MKRGKSYSASKAGCVNINTHFPWLYGPAHSRHCILSCFYCDEYGSLVGLFCSCYFFLWQFCLEFVFSVYLNYRFSILYFDLWTAFKLLFFPNCQIFWNSWHFQTFHQLLRSWAFLHFCTLLKWQIFFIICKDENN